jgi:hypothetical protein
MSGGFAASSLCLLWHPTRTTMMANNATTRTGNLGVDIRANLKFQHDSIFIASMSDMSKRPQYSYCRIHALFCLENSFEIARFIAINQLSSPFAAFLQHRRVVHCALKGERQHRNTSGLNAYESATYEKDIALPSVVNHQFAKFQHRHQSLVSRHHADLALRADQLHQRRRGFQLRSIWRNDFNAPFVRRGRHVIAQ